MSGPATFPTRARPRRPRRTIPLDVEGLEDRKLLYATLGGSWTYAARITYSFVPDGTSVGGVPSNLYSTLNSVTTTAAWKAAVQKAAAIWSSYANINLGLVPDDGTAIGASGNQQDDSRFGDIRIAMIPQNNAALAFALLPPPFNGGTSAGDIVFNSKIAWKVNSDYDLQTVAMHEFGHALGMDHSTISSAVMYAYYNNIKQSLTTDDVNGIQSVYGAYPADPIEYASFTTAQNINGLIDSNLQIALPGQSLAGASDADYFVVTVPSNTTGTMTVSMQTENLSSGSPKVVLYRSDRTSIGTTSLPNSFGATATYTVSGVTPGQVYYIRAQAASAMGSYGAYGLLVNFGSSPQAPIPPPNTVVLQQPDRGGGSTTDSIPSRGTRGRGTAAPSAGTISLGSLQAFGDVLLSAPGPGDRFDPEGLSIPVAPGGLALGVVLDNTLIDAALAQGNIAAPPDAGALGLPDVSGLTAGAWWADLLAARRRNAS